MEGAEQTCYAMHVSAKFIAPLITVGITNILAAINLVCARLVFNYRVQLFQSLLTLLLHKSLKNFVAIQHSNQLTRTR